MYHINSEGKAGKCSAEKGKCPFGKEEQHFASRKEAMENYELSRSGETLPKSLKDPNVSAGEEAVKTLNRAVYLSEFYSRKKNDLSGLKKSLEIAYGEELDGTDADFKDELFALASNMSESNTTSFIIPEYLSLVKFVSKVRDEDSHRGKVKINEDIPVSIGHVLWRKLPKNLSEDSMKEALIAANYSDRDLEGISKTEVDLVFDTAYDRRSSQGNAAVEEDFITLSKVLKSVHSRNIENRPEIDDYSRFKSIAEKWDDAQISDRVKSLKKQISGRDREIAEIAEEELEILDEILSSR